MKSSRDCELQIEMGDGEALTCESVKFSLELAPFVLRED
jgi:hypothetical protein